MKKTINQKYILIFFALLLATACITAYQPQAGQEGTTNYVSLYDPASSNLKPSACFRHVSSSESYLFFKVNAQHFMSETKADGSLSDEANLLIKYAIRSSESREIVDSASFRYKFSKSDNDEFLTYIPVKLAGNANYYASILFVDEVKKSWKRLLFDVNKSDKYAAEVFFPEVIDQQKIPLFDHYLSLNKSIKISSDVLHSKDFYLVGFENDSLMPLPIYSDRNPKEYNPEHSVIHAFQENDTLLFENQGFYKIVQDTQNVALAFPILVGGPYYPYVRTPEAMLPPLQYITKESQYRIIAKSDSLKYAIDKYWLTLGGDDPKKAKELIRIYYNRVQLANMYFTSVHEGWKSDRGMVYVLFGMPKAIYKTRAFEKWVYAENEMSTSLIFHFEKDTSSLSLNDFKLVRDSRYQQAWNQAILSWRNGQAYSIR